MKEYKITVYRPNVSVFEDEVNKMSSGGWELHSFHIAATGTITAAFERQMIELSSPLIKRRKSTVTAETE